MLNTAQCIPLHGVPGQNLEEHSLHGQGGRLSSSVWQWDAPEIVQPSCHPRGHLQGDTGLPMGHNRLLWSDIGFAKGAPLQPPKKMIKWLTLHLLDTTNQQQLLLPVFQENLHSSSLLPRLLDSQPRHITISSRLQSLLFKDLFWHFCFSTFFRMFFTTF